MGYKYCNSYNVRHKFDCETMKYDRVPMAGDGNTLLSIFPSVVAFLGCLQVKQHHSF